MVWLLDDGKSLTMRLAIYFIWFHYFSITVTFVIVWLLCDYRTLYIVSQKKETDSILAVTSINFRQLFTVFGTNHPDSPCDWKIVKCRTNTCTTLRNDDVIVTYWKCSFRKLCPEKRDRQYFGHNFDKFKYIVFIFQGISWQMRKY